MKTEEFTKDSSITLRHGKTHGFLFAISQSESPSVILGKSTQKPVQVLINQHCSKEQTIYNATFDFTVLNLIIGHTALHLFFLKLSILTTFTFRPTIDGVPCGTATLSIVHAGSGKSGMNTRAVPPL